MPEDIDNEVKDAIRGLYRSNELARKFFDHCAQRERDASETSIDRIAYRLDVSREAAIGLAQAFEQAGIGSFVVGRRGHKSRFVWEYSCISVGQVAAGENAALEEPENAVDDTDGIEVGDAGQALQTITIAEAKNLLSRSLGVPVEAIQITVQY
ncbi:hypothetical protein [Altererythrobacter epoxidivorans]|uniref:hypothetical protein n=1 Tax=Altererythrobacter epoxidivorans TaxID=361183 RepID=UPI000785C15E|nr:hypothetical protein [Altererythrobacter epoxidivorans]